MSNPTVCAIAEKLCGSCGVVKPASEFSIVHPKNRKERLHSRCKLCGVIESREWANKNPAKRKAIWRKHAEENRESYKESGRKYYRTHKAGYLERMRADRLANPQKVKARKAVELALRSGRLQAKACRDCGEVKVQAHHHDYSKPLDVIWLCSLCHGKEHRAT